MKWNIDRTHMQYILNDTVFTLFNGVVTDKQICVPKTLKVFII